MERLSLHIEYLILRHDCVIVPGFGAFINVHESARMDQTTGMIAPMTREVRFNAGLAHDDGLLAHSFARRAQTGFAEGREMLRREVETLRLALETDGEVTLGRLGILRLDAERHVGFQPMRSAESLSRDLGYESAPTKSLSAIASEEGEKEDEAPIYQLEEDCAETAPERETRRAVERDRNYYIISIPRKAVRRAARAAACMLVLAAGAVGAFNIPAVRSQHVDRASVVDTQRIEKIARETLAIDSADESAEKAETRPAPAVKQEIRPYHLIVATFRSETEADNFVAQHAESAYHLQVMPSRQVWRVSAQSASTASELQAVLNDDTFRAEYGSCWIWEDKTASRMH